MHLAHPFLSIHSSEQALKIQMFSHATKCGTSTTAMVDKIWVNHFTHTSNASSLIDSDLFLNTNQ